MAGGGFGWLTPPPRSVMEDYWRGVQMIPERHLVVAKLDKVIAGSCQIVRLPRNNEAQAFTCQLTTFFVAPRARGHGLAQMIVAEAEALAKTKGFLMINLDVRATQTRAIQSFEARGFIRYAVNEHYARVDDSCHGVLFPQGASDVRDTTISSQRSCAETFPARRLPRMSTPLPSRTSIRFVPSTFW